jgi:hypothetical protein
MLPRVYVVVPSTALLSPETAHALVPVLATSPQAVESKRKPAPVRADSSFVAHAATPDMFLLRTSKD